VPVSEWDPSKFHPQGFGTLLKEEAERIVREEQGAQKNSVIFGVDIRNIYKRLCYQLDRNYMSKKTGTMIDQYHY